MRKGTNKKYHYTESGLDNIYLLNGYKVTTTKAGKEIFIHDIHGLHKAIGENLALKQGLLSGKEIRFIRHLLDWSQTRLAHATGVNYQSILRWEKHKGSISITADRSIKWLCLAYIKSPDIYNIINEISEMDSKEDTVVQKLEFKEDDGKWRMSA